MNSKLPPKVEGLASAMRVALPSATCKPEAPDRPQGDWFIDFQFLDRMVVVQVHPDRYSMSVALSEGYGLDRPDAIGRTIDEAVKHLCALLNQQ